MKIITVTFHKAYNYGAMLQEYALNYILNSRGYNAEVLNYNDKIISNQYKLIKFNGSSNFNKVKSFIKSIIYLIPNLMRINKFKKFESNIKISKKYDSNSLKNIDANVLICGSDQIWNPDITNGIKDLYTLNFGSKKIRRISYAASIGNNENINKNIVEFNKKLSKFNFISLREESCLDNMKKALNRDDIDIVLDPTLLLTDLEWHKVLLPNFYENKKYILAYMVEPNDEFYNIVNYISNLSNIKVVTLEPRQYFKKSKIKNVMKNEYCSGPSEFLSLIYNAEYVITTSFHATVFSLIFNKKFWVIPHKKTGSRVVDLLNKVKRDDRILYNINQLKEIDYSKEINFDLSNKILDSERKKSLDWLEKSLDGVKNENK